MDAVASLPPASGQNVAEKSDRHGVVTPAPTAAIPTIAEPAPAPPVPQPAVADATPEPAVAQPAPAQQDNVEGSGTGRAPPLIQRQGAGPAATSRVRRGLQRQPPGPVPQPFLVRAP
jgi:hypothetical protein